MVLELTEAILLQGNDTHVGVGLRSNEIFDRDWHRSTWRGLSMQTRSNDAYRDQRRDNHACECSLRFHVPSHRTAFPSKRVSISAAPMDRPLVSDCFLR